MVPFHGVPVTEPPAILNTTSNEAMGLANVLSMIRTAPLKPPCQALTATTSTVTPLPETATAAVEVLPWAGGAAGPSQAERRSADRMRRRRGLERETFPGSTRVASIRPPFGDTGRLHFRCFARGRSTGNDRGPIR